MILTIIISLFISLTSAPIMAIELKDEQTEINLLRTSDFLFWIEEIKKHEGFAKGEKYICPAGYLTIGYGHVILPNEKFPDKISKKEAHELLVKDFTKAVKSVERLTNLESSKKYAIAHFIFAKGIGNFIRSTLYKRILKDEPIGEEIVKWCWYTKTNGEKVRNERSYKNRLKELNKYNYEDRKTSL